MRTDLTSCEGVGAGFTLIVTVVCGLGIVCGVCDGVFVFVSVSLCVCISSLLVCFCCVYVLRSYCRYVKW